MVRAIRSSYLVAALGLLGVASLALPSCGGSGNGSATGSGGSNGSGSGGNGNNPDGGGNGSGGNGNNGSGGKGSSGSGGSGNGTGGMVVINPPPAAKCMGAVSEAATTPLDFSTNPNLIASPSPPGSLTPATAPQIVVFGWDDIESQAGIIFVSSLFTNVTNPDGKPARANVNPNSCYGEGGAPAAGVYTCGDGTLSFARPMVAAPTFDVGNHTIDHLENTEVAPGWSGIPTMWRDTMNFGWKFTDDGMGPGISMDQATWVSVMKANDAELKVLYGTGGVLPINGFRAPRLEINDQGLNAIKAVNYQYDENLEEILPETHADAAAAIDTDSKKGFNWIPWPYTLDNGSPGIWNQQQQNDKGYVTNFPTGIWELPVYQVYVPSKDNLGKTIADTMLASDDPKNCIFPDYVAADQRMHCYLAPGELAAGDVVTEITGFDFNTFIYSRMTPAQWLEIMKHSFLLRYYGNRAPLTYGAHPVEYTEPYDSYTLAVQGNNYGFRDVTKFSTYSARQQAVRDFMSWIKSDPVLSTDTYFLSEAQLAAYMKAPFDRTGKAVAADAVATPDSNGLFSRLTWTAHGATIAVKGGNSADITFTVATAAAAPVSVTAGVTAGSLKGLSHIDIKYSTDVPFRVRLLTSDGTLSTTVLLAGVGGDRTARLRIKDFTPGPEATAAQVTAAGLVTGDYMNKVAGISFESAATAVTGAKAFTTHIEQITLHGADTAALCTQ